MMITMVRVHEFENGSKTVHVYYKNGNPYRNDRVRMYDHIPKSAEKFIKTAQDVTHRDFPTFTSDTYRA